MTRKKFWTTDKLVATMAIFISLLTLFIFIRQTNIIETQSHLSVMPYLLFETSNNGENETYSIDLSNHGVGPVIIIKKCIRYKDKTYDMELHDFLKQHIPEMDSVNIINRSTIVPGYAIPAGGGNNILKVGGNAYSYQTFLKILQQLQEDGMAYEIIYKSIYDDRWKLSSLTNEPQEMR